MSRHQVLGRMRVGELCKLLLGATLQPPVFPSLSSMPSLQQLLCIVGEEVETEVLINVPNKIIAEKFPNFKK
jgi:hypothetical protein